MLDRHHGKRAPDRAQRTQFRATCESLESRLLLACDIIWTNRGVDGFAAFGANENLARTIIDRAIGEWERIINSFNYSDGANTYLLSVSAGDAGENRAYASGLVVDGDGKPRASNIVMGTNSSWYFDPVPGTSQLPDDHEFTDPFVPPETQPTGEAFPFAAIAPTANGYDFYGTFQHEMCHALGITSSPEAALAAQLVETGLVDPNAPDYRILTFSYGGVMKASFIDGPHGLHTYEGPLLPSRPDLPLRAGDAINGGHTTGSGERRLVSDTVATILSNAYGYSVTLPSQINTFYADLDTTTHQLTIRGESDWHNVIMVDLDRSYVRVRVNVYTDDGSYATSERFPVSAVQSIDVFCGDAGSSVSVMSLPGRTPMTIHGGAGNDGISIGGSDLDADIGSSISISGGGGDDDLTIKDFSGAGDDIYKITMNSVTKENMGGRAISYSRIESLWLYPNGAGNTTINVDSSSCTIAIWGSGAVDTINVGAGDLGALHGDVIVMGDGAGDIVNVRDEDCTGNDSYIFFDDRMTTLELGELHYQNIARLTLSASAGDNIIDVLDQGTDFLLLGGSGDDLGIIHAPLTAPVAFNGGNNATDAGDTLSVVGNHTSATCTPSILFGHSGIVDLGEQAITYTRVESVRASNMDELTLVTPRGLDLLTIDSPAEERNRITGTSGGMAFAPLTFYGTPRVIIDTGVNDASGAENDQVSIGAAGVVATDLESLCISTGEGDNRVSIDGGNARLEMRASATGAVDFAARGDAQVILPLSQKLGDITIAEQARVTLDSGPLRYIRTSGLEITGKGRLDLLDGDLILDSDPKGREIDLAHVTELIASARNGGLSLWRGFGLGSRTAGATPRTALGVILNRGALDLPIYRKFDFQDVDANSILVQYTRNGDANLDGSVDGDDYTRIDAGYRSKKTGWYNGDFNYDGVIDADDYFLIDSVYMRPGERSTAPASATEPPADGVVKTPAAKKPEPDDILASLFSTEPVL